MKRLTCHCQSALLVVVLGTCSGCGTVSNQRDYWEGDWVWNSSAGRWQTLTRLGDVWWIYGGVVSDVSSFAPQPLTMLLIFDLPLSFSADTLLLPLTIIQQIVGRPGESEDEPYRSAGESADGGTESQDRRWKIMRSWFGTCPYPRPMRGRVLKNMTAIFQAAARYRESNGRWPKSLAELKEHMRTTTTRDGVPWPEVPKDPWGRDYLLVELAEWEDGIYVVCLGKDGAEDGDGLDADYRFPRWSHDFPEKSEANSNDGQLVTVWVFNGEGSRLPSGVFTSQSQAEAWISRHRLSGTLSEFPLGAGAYDHALAVSVFVPKSDRERSPDCIADFSPRLPHFHYSDGRRE